MSFRWSLILLLFLISVASAQEEELVRLRFKVEPPQATVYRTGSARDTQLGEPTRLCNANEVYVAVRTELPDQFRLLFRAEGYQDLVQTFDLSNAKENYEEITIPLDGQPIELIPIRKSYLPHALVLLALTASVGGFFFLRARTRQAVSIDQWVEQNTVASSTDDPLLGKCIGEYWLLQQIGRGGMATVYRGVRDDDPEGEVYAIKIVHSHVASGEDFQTRFQREVTIGARLSHPNIVTVYAAGSHSGHYFIALEYLEGRELRDRIPPGGCSLAETLQFLLPVFEAVAFAHQREIVHRDLKPENVLIDRQGKVKLSDFGLARSRQFSTVTVTGSVLGTPGYIAPEQLTKGGPNPASDQYSLGIMTFEVATGRLPFEGDDPMAVLFQHLQSSPPVPSELKPELPSEFDEIVLKMLEKEPEKRYPSVSEAKAALEKLLQDPMQEDS